MTSGWGPGDVASGEATQRTGEFRVRAQEAGGDRPLRVGSAVVLIRYVSAVLTLLCVAVAWVTGLANGVVLLATFFAAVFAWSVGALSRDFWSR